MPHWWNGRHATLRMWCLWCAGSSPAWGTMIKRFIQCKHLLLKAHLSESCTTIIDSYQVTSRKDMKEVLKVLREDAEDNKALAIHKRSISSMINEWRVHNLLYSFGIQKDRTKSVDLNMGQPWYVTVLYTILSPFYLHFS